MKLFLWLRGSERVFNVSLYYIGQAAEAIGIKASTLRAYVGRFEKTGNWPKTLKHLTIRLLQKEK